MNDKKDRKKNFLKRAEVIIDKFEKDNPPKKTNIINSPWTDNISDTFKVSDDERFDIFDETIKKRKYSNENINEGKKYFELRYIRKKIDDISKKNIINDIDMSNLDKENKIKIYKNEFLLCLEKAITYFNQENYIESYEFLKNSKIIRTLKEFGEFLLVIDGFNKYLLGEFLANQKEPNAKGEVRNSFIDSIEMKKYTIPLLECVRFLLSRINLPKDDNLTSVIIDAFIYNYFKINGDNKDFVDIFGNSNNINLLVSNLLALNTLFIRKDIKDINMHDDIIKDEFINMNNKIKKDYLNNLYDQLKRKPITMNDNSYNYYDSIYQKFTILIKEEIKNTNSE